MTFCLDWECSLWQLSTWYEKMRVISSIPMKPAAYLACLTALSFGGCSMLPSAGPVASEVVAAGQTQNRVLFDIVEVDNHVVSALLAQPKESFHARFAKDDNPPELKIAVGDTLSVTVWESAAGGLFSEASPPQLPSRIETADRAASPGIAAADDRDPGRTYTRDRPAPRRTISTAWRSPREPGASRLVDRRAATVDKRDRFPPTRPQRRATGGAPRYPISRWRRMVRSASLMRAEFRPPGARRRKYSKRSKHGSPARRSSLRRW